VIFGFGLSLNLAPLLSDFGTFEFSELPFPRFKNGDDYFPGYGEHYSGTGGYQTP